MNKQKWLDGLEPIVEKGPAHFIVVRGMIFYGLLFLTSQIIIKLLISDEVITLQYYLIMLACSLLVGLIFGLILWPTLERKARRLRKELHNENDSE